MISLNLIGSNPNQSNWTSSINDIQILTLICMTQLGSFSYGNEICRDLIIDIIETPFDGSELFWFRQLEWSIIKIILIAPKIYQWHLAVYGDNPSKIKMNLLVQLPVWLSSSIMSPDWIRVKVNSSNPTSVIWINWSIRVQCEILMENSFSLFHSTMAMALRTRSFDHHRTTPLFYWGW